MATTDNADRARAARQMLARGGVKAAKRIGPDWQMLVVQLPGDPKAKPVDPATVDAAKQAVDDDGNDEASFPEPMDCDHDASQAPMTEGSSRMAEICRRIRQLADDLEALGAESDAP